MSLNDQPTTLLKTIGNTPMIPLNKFFSRCDKNLRKKSNRTTPAIP